MQYIGNRSSYSVGCGRLIFQIKNFFLTTTINTILQLSPVVVGSANYESCDCITYRLSWAGPKLPKRPILKSSLYFYRYRRKTKCLDVMSMNPFTYISRTLVLRKSFSLLPFIFQKKTKCMFMIVMKHSN